MNNTIQQRLSKTKINYSYGPYNVVKGNKQWIRITEGCPHNCPWCYEPVKQKIFDIPKIIKNDIGIMDMNLLCKREALDLLKALPIKNDGEVITYEFICGVDYRFLTKRIAEEMRKHNFKRIRLAWDWFYIDQLKIRDALNIFYSVGYKPDELTLFMICNHPSISYEENCKKLELCKIWNVKVADCYYDNQIEIFKKFIPIGWSTKEAQSFRLSVRKHNRMVLYKFDPGVIGK